MLRCGKPAIATVSYDGKTWPLCKEHAKLELHPKDALLVIGPEVKR
jgi:hypothetical protein